MSHTRSKKHRLPTEPVELEIERLSHEGRGIARIDGKVAFVEGALPGERVRAGYTRRRSQYDELRSREVLSASARRVSPPCPYFGTCGGCVMQHMEPARQRELKQQVLFEQLEHSAGLSDFEALPPLQDRTTAYRRKARLAVRHVRRKGGTLVGFRERHSSFITDMDQCSVLAREVSDLIRPLRSLIDGLDSYDAIPQIEVAVGEQGAGGDDPLQVALILRHLRALSEHDRQCLLEFAREHSLELYLQPGGPATVERFWPQEGEPRLYYHLPAFGLRMGFHPGDFTQVNAGINRRMIELALDLLEPEPGDRVLDLFCGLGNFSLPLATRCASVTGIEGGREMVERAEENAARNQLSNTQFHAADLSTDWWNHGWAGESYDKLLLDPPRSGAPEVVSRVGSLGVGKLVYISCNPTTLARDAAELLDQGFRLRRAGIMDMFPHTAHVESIAEFVRV